MADINFSALGQNLVSSIQSEFKATLEENKEVAEFVARLGRRYAELSADYYLAADDAAREAAAADLERVKNTLNMEMDALAHLAKPAIMEQLKAALMVVLKFAIENLPTIIAMVRR